MQCFKPMKSILYSFITFLLFSLKSQIGIGQFINKVPNPNRPNYNTQNQQDSGLHKTKLNENDLRYFFNMGIGFYTAPNSKGIQGSFGGVINYQNLLLKVRASGGAQIDFNVKPNEYFEDFDLLLGVGIFTEKGSLMLSTGPSYIKGQKRGDKPFNITGPSYNPTKYYSTITFKTFGIPIDFVANLNLSENVAFGFEYYRNFNNIFTYSTYTLNLTFGKLWH